MKRLMKNVIRRSSRWAASQRIQNAFSRKVYPPTAAPKATRDAPRGPVATGTWLTGKMQMLRADSQQQPPLCILRIFAAKTPRRQSAFTLIEVMIAVAVVTMGIVAVLGLIPVSLKFARDTADNTLAATIAQDVFSVIRAQPFNKVNIVDPLQPTYDHNLNTYTTPPGLPDILYFDQSGAPIGANAAYYKVTITYNKWVNPSPLSGVQATVVWPATAASPINTNVFVTEVARYDSP